MQTNIKTASNKIPSFHIVKTKTQEVICFGLSFEQALSLKKHLPTGYVVKLTKLRDSIILADMSKLPKKIIDLVDVNRRLDSVSCRLDDMEKYPGGIARYFDANTPTIQNYSRYKTTQNCA